MPQLVVFLDDGGVMNDNNLAELPEIIQYLG